MSRLVTAGRLVALAAAVLLLNASLTFYNIWPTPKVRWQSHASVELAVVVLAIAAWTHWRGRLSKGALRALAVAWVALVVGRYADATAPALYGREINLFWDVRHLSAVAAMLADSTSRGLVLGVVAATIAAAGVLYAAARLALWCVADGATRPWTRHALTAAAAVLIGFFAVQQSGLSAVPVGFAPPVSRTFARQARILATQLATREAPAVSSRAQLDSDLANVRGADVYLVFVESYGAVSYDRPAFVEALAPARAEFEAAVQETGREVVSAFVDSPTFGGSSWLAHVTLMTGVEARDEDTNVVLMAQRRDTLVTTFARRGYRTVALMPGLRQQWPEGAFYRFDHIYDTKQLDYRGPRFGWWTVPDQFALARLDLLEADAGHPAPATGGEAPRFVFFPTTSTHAPFGPTAPYQPDWTRVASADPYDTADVEQSLARTPDLFDLGPSYVNAVSYAYRSIGGYVRRRADRDFVMVVIGDHQPAAAVSGEGATWEVPVHVIASRPAVLEALRARGFQTGLTPHRPRLGPMHGLLPTLLDAFGRPVQSALADLPR